MDLYNHNKELIDYLDFDNAKIMVVGDIMLDRYWHGDTSRISPEAPVPVVKIEKHEDRLGGAANVACNIRALGAKVLLTGVVGKDEAANRIQSLLKAFEVDHELVQEEVKTCTKLRVIGRSQQLIRCDFEESYELYQSSVLEAVKKHIGSVNAIVLSDYAKGTLSGVEQIIALANKAGVPVLVDPKAKDFERYRGASMITPNFKEFQHVVGEANTDEVIEQKAKSLLAKYGLRSILVTRGAKGMSLFEANQEAYHIPALAREVFDITGAGDTVIAALSCAMSIGLPLSTAASIANIAASIVVGKLGTAMVSIDELNASLSHSAHLAQTSKKIVTLDALLDRLKSFRKQKKIVMTNGCFDILHAGHVDYLAKARNFGDALIVAVNTDASVKALKGDSRPINNLGARMSVLAALQCVDWVVPFAESTPLHLIEAMSPDILVKGADYKVHEIAGSEHVLATGGEVKLVDLVPGCSTTGTLEKIQSETELVGES